MLKRAERMSFPQRVFLLVLALAFATTSVLQALLAMSVSEWWPVVLAALLALSASWCLATAARACDGDRRGRLR
ncbi:protein-S-isoprenylcysteine O-methyltransferase Ste14 [Saccharomonospora amisosensis]|uniref:Protein-S-isoprenylcysteine O-methyltransferase Ste14 n=1 Tax=Saccharomonospora amisosensis TaxID=1128677 RepID=A0A7X5UUU0_9PSEU|nr:hypothetical protein [Saccharomonospora amisosensis]NIJ14674.1 protein-S-isoprenylcysteine O-methyltransferase Ste14 [Saccharomonospora amisosensis]